LTGFGCGERKRAGERESNEGQRNVFKVKNDGKFKMGKETIRTRRLNGDGQVPRDDGSRDSEANRTIS
jgi:hypothetical protein